MAVEYQSFAEAKLDTWASSITIDKPAGVVEGDFHILVIFWEAVRVMVL